MKIRKTQQRDEIEFIHQNLYDFNLSKTGGKKETVRLSDSIEYSAFLALHGPDEEIRGGIVFHPDSDGLFVDFLWISEYLRGQGAGSKLVESVKDEAKNLNKRYIRLYTHRFQAPDFYPKLGFRLTHVDEDKNLPGNKIYHFELDLFPSTDK